MESCGFWAINNEQHFPRIDQFGPKWNYMSHSHRMHARNLKSKFETWYKYIELF